MADLQSSTVGALPRLSIVMPVRNEGCFIRRTLQQLQQQDYPPDKVEVIVVDGESDDNTADEAREVAIGSRFPIRVVNNPGRLSSVARNIGVRAATGDWIVIVDGHVYVQNSQLFSSIAEIASRTGAIVLGRPQRLCPPGISPFQAAVAIFRASPLGHSPNSKIFSLEEGWVDPGSVGVMYARQVFERFGYFDETLDAAEDYEFNSRLSAAGVRCYTSPRLEVLYYPRESLVALYRQMKRYGFGQSQIASRDAASRATGGSLLALGVLAIPVVLAAAMLSKTIASLVVAGTIVYTLVVVWVTGAFLRRHPESIVVMVAIAVVVHLGVGIGWWAARRLPIGVRRAWRRP